MGNGNVLSKCIQQLLQVAMIWLGTKCRSPLQFLISNHTCFLSVIRVSSDNLTFPIFKWSTRFETCERKKSIFGRVSNLSMDQPSSNMNWSWLVKLLGTGRYVSRSLKQIRKRSMTESNHRRFYEMGCSISPWACNIDEITHTYILDIVLPEFIL